MRGARNTLTNENFEKAATEAQEQRLSAPQQQARADRKTFEAMAEEPKSDFDVRDIF